jgi:hypothetical protein
MRLTTCLGLASFALLCFGAPSALAENCNAPPGTSGIDQYCESIPTPGGSGGSHKHGDAGKARHLSPSTTKTLQQSGAAGAAVLALTGSAGTPASAPAKKPAARSRHHRKGAAHKPATTPQKSAGAGPAAQDPTPAAKTSFDAGNSVGGSLGVGFIVVLVAIGLLMGALAWFGRRRAEPGASA